MSRFVVCVSGSLLLLALGCAKKSETTEPTLHAAVTASAHTEGTLLAVGSPLPALEATSQSGERVSLSALRGKPVVVYFYPKDDTPGCTVEAQEIRDSFQELASTGAVVIGVSVDDAASHKAFAEKYGLPFLLVPDPERAWVSAFGVPQKNGRAARVTFVFGRDGKLAKVFPEVKPQGHAHELTEVLHALGA